MNCEYASAVPAVPNSLQSTAAVIFSAKKKLNVISAVFVPSVWNVPFFLPAIVTHHSVQLKTFSLYLLNMVFSLRYYSIITTGFSALKPNVACCNCLHT